MKRRSFLAALFAAPMVPAVAKIAATPQVDMPADMPPVPLIFENGGVVMSAAEIGQVRAGRLVSFDGFAIDLSAGTMTFRG